MSHILDAAYHLVQAYPGGAEALAPRINKNPTTLRHEVNGTGTAKLGLSDAVNATVLSRDLRILNAFAAECDCMVLPMPAPIDCDNTAMHRVAALAKEFGEMVASVTAAAADGRITANELDAIQRDYAELVAAGQALMAHLQAKHQAGLPTLPNA